jgi:glycosyltransferase involved in cell wall biosynthesis
MLHLSHKEIDKYNRLYLDNPEYGQIIANEPRFIVALNYLSSICGVKTILDAGVGRGGFYNLVKNDYDVYGIEPSTIAIEKFYKADKRIINTYIQDLPDYFSENTFDAVACLDVLEHIPTDDIDLALSTLARCGKKYFIFSIANHPDVWDGMNLHVSIFSFEEWEEKLEKHFEVLSMIPIHNGRAVVYLLEKSGCEDGKLMFDCDRLESLEFKRLTLGKKYTPSMITHVYNQAKYSSLVPDSDYFHKEDDDAITSLIPAPKEFVLRESGYKAKNAKLWYCRLAIPQPDKDGVYHLYFIFGNKEKKWENTKITPYTNALKEFLVIDPETKEEMLITAKDIYECLKQNYDFVAAYSNYRRNRAKDGLKPRVAFTLMSSSTKGGGSMNVFRYVNWLSELGVDVAVYSDDEPPDWINVKGKFYCIKNLPERYSAISEPVIIVYTVRELQDLLLFGNTKDKVIYHLCQGIEEHHFGRDYSSLMASKPMFELLHSLPVGRLVVSSHIQDYFERNYSQKTHSIFNGIDLNFFTPQSKSLSDKKIDILSIGRPTHTLKGKADIINALDLTAKAHPDLNFCLTIVTGQKKSSTDCFGSDTGPFDCETHYHFENSQGNFTCKKKYALSKEQIRQLYYSSDIYINSSWYEGFGLPTLEAMACGVPVIQADNQGLDGVVFDKKNCLLIPPNNPRKMSEAIEILINNDTLRNNLITNGIETAHSFSIEKQFEMFVTEFEKILHCKFDESLVDAKKSELNFKHTKTNTNKFHKPLFSILVPTYNQAKYLPETLDSIINQTYDDWEAVVVNDGSTDETAEVLKKYVEKDSRIRAFYKDNGGVSSALNEGLRNARGEWICWLSSDDLFERDKLEIHLQAIREYPDIHFFHTNYSVLYEDTGCISPSGLNLSTFIPPLELQVLKFFEINYFNGISIAIHRDIFEQVGHFNEGYKAGQDFDMWLRISTLYRSHFINKQTCITRIHPAQGTDFLTGSTFRDSPGIYDSARACLDFLNNHEFPAIFPTLDLSVTDQALFAIKNTIRVVVNPFSFINRCGYAPALMDRLYEWVTNSAPAELRVQLRPHLERIFSQIQNTKLPEEIKMAFPSKPGFLEKPFRYESYDPLSEIRLHADRLETIGELKRANLLKEYHAKNSNKTTQGVSVDSQPLFSVLVPTYNQAKYLPVALDSILNQTYDNWEAIVINDGSSDETAQIMKCYAEKDKRIRIFHKENSGVASALNEGLRNARGEWICWLSSDDFFEPDKLEIHLKYIKENPHILFFYTNYLIFAEEIGTKCTLKQDPRECIPPAELQVLKFLDNNYIDGISVAINRQVLNHIGLFNEEYRYGQDFEMWLRITAHYRALFIDHKTCVTRWHPNQGMNQFPGGGSYDSSRACIEFLNSHKLNECFPLLDLTAPDQVSKAIKETLTVVLNPNAMMYKGYFNTALLERLAEWLSQECPKNLKQVLMPHLEGAVNKVTNSQLPEEVKKALLEFLDNIENNFQYRPHDFLKEAAQYAQKLFSVGDWKKAESIERYLSTMKPRLFLNEEVYCK